MVAVGGFEVLSVLDFRLAMGRDGVTVPTVPD